MATPDNFQMLLIGMGGLIMLCIMLSGIGNWSMAEASEKIGARRELEARRQEEDALAEAAGRAAALEPLALNADGTIEEPILAMIEKR